MAEGQRDQRVSVTSKADDGLWEAVSGRRQTRWLFVIYWCSNTLQLHSPPNNFVRIRVDLQISVSILHDSLLFGQQFLRCNFKGKLEVRISFEMPKMPGKSLFYRKRELVGLETA